MRGELVSAAGRLHGRIEASQGFLGALGALSLIASAVLMPLRPIAPLPAAIVFFLALLAECLAVQMGRHGIRVTFGIGYVATVAYLFGALPAVATDLVITLLSAYAWMISRRQRPSMYWQSVNATICALSGLAGSIALQVVLMAPLGFEVSMMLSTAAFILVYGLINRHCVRHFRTQMGFRTRGAIQQGFDAGAYVSILHLIVCWTAVLLIVDGQAVWAPLTLIPILCLRASQVQRAKLDDAYYETMAGLTLMLQRAHPYSHGHIERVSRLAETVALRLGMDRSRARLVREAALLHDVGKIAIDEGILDKPSKLTHEEMEHVRAHAQYGAQILAEARQFTPIVTWIMHHHERPDGTGYPTGLAGDQIPLESRIIAVTDAYDAMIGDSYAGTARSYKQPMSPAAALEELRKCCDTQFDRTVVRVFEEVVATEHSA